jgi:two-component system invasion response regulator UvrY
MSDIYLVDDHALMRDSLRAVLEDAGHRVVGESADPTQALAELQALTPALLLLDLNLGARSAMCSRARRRTRCWPRSTTC